MDIKDMLYISEIAKAGYLSAAAKELRISQPTLSVFLARLEESLGTELFYRDKKQLIPTPAGRIYLDAARKILQIHDQTYLAIHRLRHAEQQVLRIGATPLRGASLFASIYPALSRRYPEVRLELREAYTRELLSDVLKGNLDFAFGSCAELDNPDFDYLPNWREELLLAVPSFHPLAEKGGRPGAVLPAISADEIRDAAFVLLPKSTAIRKLADNYFQSNHIYPTVVYESNNNLVVRNMIRQGAGIGFLPASLAEPTETELRFFSLSPQLYLFLVQILKKGHQPTEAERYISYLSRKLGKAPSYLSFSNGLTAEIDREFEKL